MSIFWCVLSLIDNTHLASAKVCNITPCHLILPVPCSHAVALLLSKFRFEPLIKEP
jgi:hypothetical protein